MQLVLTGSTKGPDLYILPQIVIPLYNKKNCNVLNERPQRSFYLMRTYRTALTANKSYMPSLISTQHTIAIMSCLSL